MVTAQPCISLPQNADGCQADLDAKFLCPGGGPVEHPSHMLLLVGVKGVPRALMLPQYELGVLYAVGR